MDRRLLAVLPVLLAIAIGLAAPLASAYTSGVVYLPPRASFSVPYEKVVAEGLTVQVPAASTDANGNTVPGTNTIDLAQYTSGLAGIQAIKVRVTDASGQVTLKAVDANGSVIAQADVIPLASGYEVTLPGTTANITIENLMQNIWQGTITIVVQTSIDVELQFQQSQITVVGGQGLAPATIVVKSLPAAGSLSLSDDRLDFSVTFSDPSDVDQDGKTDSDTHIYVQSHSDPNNPATYDVQVKVSTSAAPGTYTVKLYLYYYEGLRLDVDPPAPGVEGQKIGELTLNVALQDDGTGTVQPQPVEDGIPVKWALAVLFLVIIFMAFMAMMRK